MRSLAVLAGGGVAANGPKEEVFRHPPTLEVARLTGCKNFSRARINASEPARNRFGDGRLIEAMDWGCTLRVTQQFSTPPAHVAIRAHHIRVHPPGTPLAGRENVFPCWLAAMTETPFRVTLDLRIGAPPSNAADFQAQAEVFKREWESFGNFPQPWQVEFPTDRLFLLPG